MKNVQATLLFLTLSGLAAPCMADGKLSGLLDKVFGGGSQPAGSEPLALLLTGLIGIMMGTWPRR